MRETAQKANKPQ